MPAPPFSLPIALELGRFVVTAYDQFAAPDPSAIALPAGYTLLTYIYADDITDNLPDYKLFGFIARSGTDVVVAIRGTETYLEWIMNVFFVPVPFPFVDGAGKTEQGFTNFYKTFCTGSTAAAPRVAEMLASLVSDGSVITLRIGAHSLGSALAKMLAVELVAKGIFLTPSIYTFGSPKVGDKVFAGRYDDLVMDSWRIANLNDLVPHLPPRWAGYVHVDAELPINSDDTTQHNVRCWHSIYTYLHTLDTTSALDSTCVPR